MDDIACRWLKQDSRSRLVAAMELLLQDRVLHVPPILFAAKDPEYWKSLLAQTGYQHEHDHIEFMKWDDAELTSICTGATWPSDTNVDMFLCSDHSDTKRASVHTRPPSSAILVTGLAQQSHQQTWLEIYPPYTPTRKQLSITLWLDTGINARIWLSKIDDWLTGRHNITIWPCLENTETVQVSYQLSDFSSILQRRHIDDGNETMTVWRFPLSEMEPTLSIIAGGDDDTILESILVVSDKIIEFENGTNGETSDIATGHDGIVLAALTESTGEEMFSWLMDALFTTCMGLNQDSPLYNTGSVPTWYTKLWYQRRLRERYKDLVHQLTLEHTIMQQLSWKVRISNDIAETWLTAVRRIQSAEQYGAKGSYMRALSALNDAQSLLIRLQRNPNLQEPIDFPPDHYAGIFVPLVIPLLLPTLLGFVRELRRYRAWKLSSSPVKLKQD